jgi:hypothetical protein
VIVSDYFRKERNAQHFALCGSSKKVECVLQTLRAYGTLLSSLRERLLLKAKLRSAGGDCAPSAKMRAPLAFARRVLFCQDARSLDRNDDPPVEKL